jgi:hypothetical protein
MSQIHCSNPSAVRAVHEGGQDCPQRARRHKLVYGSPIAVTKATSECVSHYDGSSDPRSKGFPE